MQRKGIYSVYTQIHKQTHTHPYTHTYTHTSPHAHTNTHAHKHHTLAQNVQKQQCYINVNVM